MSTNNDCIIWTGHKWAQGRYGLDRINGRNTGAHRAAWIRANGEIPEGLLVCHKCDNGLCVNVEHLFLGTPSDNIQDCIRKGRNPMLFLKNQKGKNNLNARDDYEYIRSKSKEMRSLGFTLSEIRNALNIKSNGHLMNLIRS